MSDIDFGNLIRTGNKKDIKPINVLPTGFTEIDDELLEVGGFVRGRITEISAFEGQGKTTFLLNLIGYWQKQGLKCCFGDAEGVLTQSWAEACGVDWQELDIIEPCPAESFINKLKMITAANIYDIIAVDSISVFNPEDLAKSKDVGKLTMHDNLKSAQLMKAFLNGMQSGFSANDAKGKPITGGGVWTLTQKGEKLDKTIHLLRDKKTHLFFIAHLAEKPGLTFGDSYYTSGGKKKDFAYTTRLRLFASRKTATRKGQTVLLGKTLKIHLWKSKTSVPYKTVQMFLDVDGTLKSLNAPEQEISDSQEETPVKFLADDNTED